MKSLFFAVPVVVGLPFFVISLVGCQSETETGSPETSESSRVAGGDHLDPWEAVSTFYGIIPCASCPGIEMTIQLKPDGTFFLRSVYLEAENGEDRAMADMGRWSRTAGNDMLILRGGTEGARRWSIASADTLRMLNNLAEPIESDLPYQLVRIDDAQQLSGTGRMSGMYRYMADAAIFEECRTRKRYPVVFEEAHIDLERAYLKTQEEPGQPLKAVFDGRVELRPRMEGDGEWEFVVVSEFKNLFPGETCFEAESPLEETMWNLIELNGRPVEFSDRTRIPHVVLISEDGQAAGSGGCNRFTGGYSVSADSLTFGLLASTMMACQDEMVQEAAFLGALGATTNYDLYGNMLELWSDGRFLARLEGSIPKESHESEE